jgi:hypothetical protein
MEFGTLVRKVLGGKEITTLEEVENDFKFRSSIDLAIPTLLVGHITFVGLTHKEFISDLSKAKRWTFTIERKFPEDRAATAREESDFFLDKLEDMEELMPHDIALASMWSGTPTWGTTSPRLIIKFQKLPSVGPKNGGILGFDITIEPRLFLLDRLEETTPLCGGMGLAPCGARKGDAICLVKGIKRALVLRMDDEDPEYMEIIGTAIADNYLKIKRAREEGAELHPGFVAADF